MKTIQRFITIALLSTLVSTPAFADNTGKAYIAGDLGAATYSNVSPFPNPGVIRFALGYHFSPNLAGEMGYSKFGDSTVTGPGGSATLTASSFQFGVVGSLPLNPQFDAFGKLGISHNSFSASNTLGMAGSASQNSLMFGLGAQYHLNSQFDLRVQYEDFGDFESNSPAMKATAFSFGVVYNFQ